MTTNPRTIGVIMGGGRGTRLYPLTKDRCKPAVPLGGKYRLVDVPISNCLHSGINRIFVLTQFNTASLHRHIQNTYRFDAFSGGFVDILAAEQTLSGDAWYQGTADAVRRNLMHFNDHPHDLVVILSGDQLYRLELRDLVRHHVASGAQVTIAAKPYPATKVEGLGLMRIEDDQSIVQFVEKPKDPKVIRSLTLTPLIEGRLRQRPSEPCCLASMGIYVFDRDVLRRAIDNTMTDFGKEVIPNLLGKVRLTAYIFEGYWEDIGTVRSFFEANLALTDDNPPFNFFVPGLPIYTHARYLPSTRIDRSQLDRAIVAEGCMLHESRLSRCVVGIRSVVREGAVLENVVMMGADYYENSVARDVRPQIGIGRRCSIRNAIIDKNARIGDDSVLSPEGKPDLYEKDGLFVRDGVLVVCKNAVVPPGTQF